MPAVFTGRGFKECPACGRVWLSREDYLRAVRLVVLTDAMGLSLLNCPCGTTHGWDALLLWPERQDEIERIWASDIDFQHAPLLHCKRVMKDFNARRLEFRHRFRNTYPYGEIKTDDLD